jgi:hypothetical protein
MPLASENDAQRVRDDIEIRRQLRDDVSAKAGVASSAQRRSFVSAWYSRMERADHLSDRFKMWYYVAYSLTSLAAASVPALITAAGSSDAQAAKVMRFFAAGLGVFVAFATAVLGVVQVGNRWRLYRTYSQSLEAAGWDYMDGDGGESEYRDFVRAVTKAHRTYCREYLTQVAVQQGSAVPDTATGSS